MRTKKVNSRSLILTACALLSISAFSIAIAIPAFAAEGGPWWEKVDCPCSNNEIGHKHVCQTENQTAWNCTTGDTETSCQNNVTDQKCDYIE
jgi:hypothetical protein